MGRGPHSRDPLLLWSGLHPGDLYGHLLQAPISKAHGAGAFRLGYRSTKERDQEEHRLWPQPEKRGVSQGLNTLCARRVLDLILTLKGYYIKARKATGIASVTEGRTDLVWCRSVPGRATRLDFSRQRGATGSMRSSRCSLINAPRRLSATARSGPAAGAL